MKSTSVYPSYYFCEEGLTVWCGSRFRRSEFCKLTLDIPQDDHHRKGGIQNYCRWSTHCVLKLALDENCNESGQKA